MAQHTTPAKIEHALWPALLIAVSAVSTLGFACVTPFAAFTVAAALVLPIRSALFSVAGIWLPNQAIGFAFLGYPWAVDTMLWGLAIGASALIATVVAAAVLRVADGWNLAVALGMGLIAAFIAYEAGLFLVTFVLGGRDAFTPAIIGQFALLNLVWAVGLVGTHIIFRHSGSMARLRPSMGRAAG